MTHCRLVPRALIAAALAAATTVVPVTATTTARSAGASVVTTTGTQSIAATTSLRDDTVSRARALLRNQHRFQTRAGGTKLLSTTSTGRNQLERNGSDANRNEFNGFNGYDWCGYFVATAWTGKRVPNASSYPRLPSLYMRASAWRTDSGDRYRRYSVDRMPRRGDVMVWQNGPGRPGQVTSEAFGHVGVVVHVNRDTRRVRTIEGNVAGDEIRRYSYSWDGPEGPTKAGKHFLGHTKRV